MLKNNKILLVWLIACLFFNVNFSFIGQHPSPYVRIYNFSQNILVGSGLFINSHGDIITAGHVVKGADVINGWKSVMVKTSSGEEYLAFVMADDEYSDSALLVIQCKIMPDGTPDYNFKRRFLFRKIALFSSLSNKEVFLKAFWQNNQPASIKVRLLTADGLRQKHLPIPRGCKKEELYALTTIDPYEFMGMSGGAYVQNNKVVAFHRANISLNICSDNKKQLF